MVLFALVRFDFAWLAASWFLVGWCCWSALGLLCFVFGVCRFGPLDRFWSAGCFGWLAGFLVLGWFVLVWCVFALLGLVLVLFLVC